MPVGNPKFAEQVEATAAFETMGPYRRRFPCELIALVMLAGSKTQPKGRSAVEFLRGRRSSQAKGCCGQSGCDGAMEYVSMFHEVLFLLVHLTAQPPPNER